MVGGIFDNKLFDRNTFDVRNEFVASANITQAGNSSSASGFTTVVPGIFDTNIFDRGIFDRPVLEIFGTASIVQASNSASSSAAVEVKGTASATQTGAAVESFRNEMVRSNESNRQVLIRTIGVDSGVKLIEG